MSPALAQTAGLPNDPLFQKLLRNAQENQNLLIRDTPSGIDATAADFLRDVTICRDYIRHQLPSHLFNAHAVAEKSDISICILAPLSYEFLVAFYAVIALGGVAVPLCMVASKPGSIYP